MKTMKVVLCLVLSSLLLAVTAHAEEYMFGVHPFKKPTKLKTMFTPLVNYLSQELGAKVTFRSFRNYDEAMEAFIDGKVDFSYFGPSMYAILDEQYPGKIRVAAAIENNGKPTFQGVIVAREDSPINSLADLKGKKFAFGDRESTLSCYMPAYMLMEAGVCDSVDFKFIGSHTNVAKGVLNGTFDAGGLKPGVAKEYIGKGLKIIATSEPVYEHVIVIGPNVDQAVADKVQQALLNVKDPVVYTSIKDSLTGFALVKSSDYTNIKEVIVAVDARFPK